MAADSLPQPGLASRSLGARLFSVGGNGNFNLISEMQGLTGVGAASLAEEPALAATPHPGDLLLTFLYEGKLQMAYITKIEVDGGSDQDEGSSSGSSSRDEPEEEHEGSSTGAESEDEPDDEEEEQTEQSSIYGSRWRGTCIEPDKEEHKGSSTGSESKDEPNEEEEQQSEQSSIYGSSSVSDTDDSEVGLDPEKEVKEENRHLHIRVWKEYCVLVFFEGERWKLTKQQPIQWLQENQVEETNQRIKSENEFKQVKDLWSLECSQAVELFIKSELSPDIMNYNIDELLGDGATCEVYGAGSNYAIKMMKLTAKFDDAGALEYKEPREVTILSSFRDSAVVSFFQAWAGNGIYKTCLKRSSAEGSEEGFDDEDSEFDDGSEDERAPSYVVIQMEYCGRTLRKFLDSKDREKDVEQSWFLLKEITKAIQFIHRSGVIHRDLKPANIFFGYVDADTIKLGDFGHGCWAKQYTADEGGTPNRGTRGYCAPELDGEKPKTSPTDKADIFSLGIILLELFYVFRTVYQRREVLKGLKGLSTDQYPDPADSRWYGDVALLKKLVAPCPSQRPSADEILEYIANRP